MAVSGTLNSANITNNGAFNVNGTASVTTLSGTGGTTVSTGASLTADHVRQNTLTLSGAAVATINTNGGDSGVSIVDALSLAGGATPTAKLDLKDNDLIIHSAGGVAGQALANLTADQIKAAQNGLDGNDQANWDGNGITSSTARSNNLAATLDIYGLGVLLNEDLDTAGVNGAWSTLPNTSIAVVTSDVLVKYTCVGDADLSGSVDADDYTYFLLGLFNDPSVASATPWMKGDFNYDGFVNADDYTLFLNGYFNQTTPLDNGIPMSALFEMAASFGLDYNFPTDEPIPEPTSLTLLGLGAAGLLLRKRKA